MYGLVNSNISYNIWNILSILTADAKKAAPVGQPVFLNHSRVYQLFTKEGAYILGCWRLGQSKTGQMRSIRSTAKLISDQSRNSLSLAMIPNLLH